MRCASRLRRWRAGRQRSFPARPGNPGVRPGAGSRVIGTGLLALAASAPAGGARAATVQTDFPCYLQNRTVRLSGAGFAPKAGYTVSVDGHSLGMGTSNDDGTLAGTLASGRLFGGASHQRHRVSASDGTNSATAEFQVTRFSADFAPTAGNPRTLRVRFSVFAFALGNPQQVSVYLHYLSPGGHVRRTVRLGRTHGACGSLPLTRRRRLFPFRPVAGRWQLQFDASRHYSASNRPHVVRTLAVRGR